MHKYFAKTLFLGKKVEFLPECHSTNDELRKRTKNSDIPEGYLVHTDYQTGGRGQRGNIWVSDRGKNLLFSFYLNPKFLLPSQVFWLNIVAGLAIHKALSNYIDGQFLSIKWPNDVYAGDHKIAGVLVETFIERQCISGAIVGIGLNVNQQHLPLGTATSIYMEINREVDRLFILEELLHIFEGFYLKLKGGGFQEVLAEYYKSMRWRGELHWFQSDSEKFEGEILGIDKSGRLALKTMNGVESFNFKEIEFLY